MSSAQRITKLVPSQEAAAKALASLLPQALPGALKTGKLNLYQTLSRLPQQGVGAVVHQQRWSRKGIDESYWEVTRSQTKNMGSNGKAWGRLYWKGECNDFFGSIHARQRVIITSLLIIAMTVKLQVQAIRLILHAPTNTGVLRYILVLILLHPSFHALP
jgi:small subunit ribosomal protein S34